MRTFRDLETNLEWLLEDFNPMSWEEAMELNIEGFKLPTMAQLLTLVDNSVSDPVCSKPVGILSAYYWTNMSCEPDVEYAWYVGFNYVSVATRRKSKNYYIRLVRPLEGKK